MEAPNKEVTLDMQGKEELLVPNNGVSKGVQQDSITGIVSNETTTCEVVDKLKSCAVLELSSQPILRDYEHLFPQDGDISAKHQRYNHTCRLNIYTMFSSIEFKILFLMFCFTTPATTTSCGTSAEVKDQKRE